MTARFEPQRLLGSGNQGEVWLAHDRQLDRWVAIKSGPSLDHEACDFPVCEAVVPLYDRLEDGRLVYEYCPWPTLEQRLSSGPITASECEVIFRHAWRALAALFASGWAHGDLAPDNLLVSATGEVRLIDLGSRVRPNQAPRTIRPSYSAPEVQSGSAVNEAAEVYAMAQVLMCAIGRVQGVKCLRRRLLACLAETPKARPTLAHLTQPLQDKRHSSGRVLVLVAGLIAAFPLGDITPERGPWHQLTSSIDAPTPRLRPLPP